MQQIKLFCTILGGECRRFQMTTVRNSFYSQKRQIFFLTWFIDVFNRVDTKRLKLIGPDCTCAEWLLRNGARVRFKGHADFITDYNSLILLEESREYQLKVEEIHAKECGISSRGFDHLEGCEHIKKITLNRCSHINDEALYKLIFVRSTLEHLELISCYYIRDIGVKSLQHLKHLKVLVLSGLASVRKIDECEAHLRRLLPECKIEIRKSAKN